jgi:hypothetical protein
MLLKLNEELMPDFCIVGVVVDGRDPLCRRKGAPTNRSAQLGSLSSIRSTDCASELIR